MNTEAIIEYLLHHGIKPTANRIVIVETLSRVDYPMSMKEIESKIQTIDKSNISRTLNLFRKHHLVHQLEDGSDMVRYELCRSNNHEEDNDMHVHFYCERCHHTYCLSDTPIPKAELPKGFKLNSINYMMKGVCTKCKAKE